MCFCTVSSREVFGCILQWNFVQTSKTGYCWLWVFSCYWTCGRNQPQMEHITGMNHIAQYLHTYNSKDTSNKYVYIFTFIYDIIRILGHCMCLWLPSLVVTKMLKGSTARLNASMPCISKDVLWLHPNKNIVFSNKSTAANVAVCKHFEHPHSLYTFPLTHDHLLYSVHVILFVHLVWHYVPNFVWTLLYRMHGTNEFTVTLVCRYHMHLDWQHWATDIDSWDTSAIVQLLR